MTSDSIYDVAVLGGGPGGYVCAIRCAQLGLQVALIEKYPHLGGTCLNVGCIPSKALLHSTEIYQQVCKAGQHGVMVDTPRIDLSAMMQRKSAVVDQLRKGVATLVAKRGISVHTGTGSFVDATTLAVDSGDGKTTHVKARHIVIASGSVAAELPFLKADGIRIITSTEALSLEQIPQSMIVIGGGAIGLEMGSVWARMGCAVTIVEFLPTIAAGSDADVSKMAERIFKKQGMNFLTATEVGAAEVLDNRVRLTCRKAGKEQVLEAEMVLLAVGRKPYTEGLQLAHAGLETDAKGRIPVDQLRTSVPNIWAVGDVVSGPMLAHKAEEDGVAVANAIAGKPLHCDYSRVPNVIYTHPEIASVGLTEKAATEQGIAIKIGKFPLLANGRAIAQAATEGFSKIIACAKTDRILGASIIAAGASEMIANVVAHMEYGGSAEDLGHTVHAHPTQSESIKEAALAVHQDAIHSL